MRPSVLLSALVALAIVFSAGCASQALPPADKGNGADTTTPQAVMPPDAPTDITGDHNGGNAVVDIVYVKERASGRGDGSSWDNAFGDLQDALDAVGGSPAEIWVAAGAYLPVQDHTGDRNPTDPRTRTFQLQNDVTIYGGFPANATDGTGMDARDWETHRTVLSGDLNGNGQIDDDDAYSVFHHQVGLNLDGTAILDGVTITGGNANGESWHAFGGGMFNYENDPFIHNVTFINNAGVFGGAVSNVTASPALLNVVIADNTANLGGGIYNRDRSYPPVTDSVISGNHATSDGGGVHVESGSAPVFSNVTITENTADRLGGGVYTHDDGGLTLADTYVTGNFAEHTGGGIFADLSEFSMTNVVISGNTARVGGGVLILGGTPWFINVTIAGNEASLHGGGLAVIDRSEGEMYNSIIWGNKAPDAVDVYSEDLTTTFTYSLVGGSGGSRNWSAAIGQDGGGNIDADPLFVSPAGDYRLGAGSPAIDTGSPDYIAPLHTLDLDGLTRVVGNGPDLGAYEFQN